MKNTRVLLLISWHVVLPMLLQERLKQLLLVPI